jgi:uncharacterized membrane protein YdjX (TVP38/TMEM64 family)
MPEQQLKLIQPALLFAVAAIPIVAFLLSGAVRSEFGQAMTVLGQGDAEALRAYLRSFGHWAPVVSLLLMIAQALLAPVPGFLITVANGLVFGVFWGSLLSLAGQALAAAICFWLARALGRGPVETLAGRLGLASADRWFDRWGARGVLLARLMPGVSFDAVSYAAGLTRMRFGRFAAVTIIGAAPQAVLYAYLGGAAPQYTWALLAMTAVVIGAVAVMALVRRRKRSRGKGLTTIPST